MTASAPLSYQVILDKVHQHLDVGDNRRDACAAAGISELNFLRWIQRYERQLTQPEASELTALEAADAIDKRGSDMPQPAREEL